MFEQPYTLSSAPTECIFRNINNRKKVRQPLGMTEEAMGCILQFYHHKMQSFIGVMCLNLPYFWFAQITNQSVTYKQKTYPSPQSGIASPVYTCRYVCIIGCPQPWQSWGSTWCLWVKLEPKAHEMFLLSKHKHTSTVWMCAPFHVKTFVDCLWLMTWKQARMWGHKMSFLVSCSDVVPVVITYAPGLKVLKPLLALAEETDWHYP